LKLQACLNVLKSYDVLIIMQHTLVTIKDNADKTISYSNHKTKELRELVSKLFAERFFANALPTKIHSFAYML